MNFLKKIFGIKAEADDPRIPINRAPRVEITALHRVSFVSTEPKAKLAVKNISVGGMALMQPGKNTFFEVGRVMRGILKVDKNEFEIEAHIRHVSEVLIGCEFIGEDPAFRRAIELYLRIEILALMLRAVDPAYIKQDPRGMALWFSDGKQNEIYVVSDDDGPVHFHMSFFGNYLEYDRGKDVQGGFVDDESDENTSPGFKTASDVKMSKVVDSSTMNLAKTLVRNITRMPPELREQIDTILSKAF